MESCALRICLIAVLFQIGLCLNIYNPDEPSKRIFFKSVERGSTLQLNCVESTDTANGEHYAMLVVSWFKVQLDEKKDIAFSGSEISTLGSLKKNSEFLKTGRFALNFKDFNNGSIAVPLTIKDVVEEDSGWYTCIASNDDDKHFSIRYEIQVYTPPTKLLLTGQATEELNDTSVNGPMLFYATEPGILTCTAANANPAPTLRITIEGQNNALTGHGDPVVAFSLEGSVKDLMKMRYSTTVIVRNVEIRANQNGKRVFCEAIYQGADGVQRDANRTSRVLSVMYQPRIVKCNKEWKANSGDKNVEFGCTFEANPAPMVLWKAHASKIVPVYPDGNVVNNLYYAKVKIMSTKTTGNISLLHTSFHLVKVTDNSFHIYTLELSNNFGQIEKQFVLSPGERVVTDTVVLGGACNVMSSVFLISIVTLILGLFQQ